ncbi:hypothetical protein [Uliginosibacterium gangwonense]|uniref:hypothetical protein n=1 Tax=Uliginosibacterium gangwonense TaxID=392736 RepID=UPI000367D13F|nr:hypothetical protein [Uliginosibacterium gangwonense]
MSSRLSTQIIMHSPLLAQAQSGSSAVSSSARMSIRPKAILEVVRRRGRSWGLLAQYEESRLGGSR